MIIVSYVIAFIIAGLAFYPLMPFQIPASIIVHVNSFVWLYVLMFSGFVGLYLSTVKSLTIPLRILLIYLWITCFLSAAPYLSFNCYVLVVLSFLLFLLIQKCKTQVFLNVIHVVFIYQALWGCVQLFGKDVLINFDRPQPIFLGTILQTMRFGSLMAILTPFLILKNKLYIFPVIAVAIVSQVSGFGLALIGGMLVYFLLSSSEYRVSIIITALVLTVAYLIYDRGSYNAALLFGRIPWWGRIISTGFPRIFTGWGMGTFVDLFAVILRDPGAFAQAHNDWLQIPWETGVTGLGLISAYTYRLIKKLYHKRAFLYISGLACISINMFFAFPMRMIQTVMLLVLYLALCHKEAYGVNKITNS